MRWISSAVFIGLVSAIVALAMNNIRLQSKSRDVEASLRQITADQIRPKPSPATYSERTLFLSTCNALLSSCSDGECPGLKECRAYLTENAPSVSLDNAESIGDAMRKTVQQSFIFARGLETFDSVAQFERFASINYNFAMYYGELDIRRGDFETVSAIEECAYKKFSEYGNMFRSLGRTDLEVVASNYLHRLSKHIESQNGFARQGIRHIVWLNTECARNMFPGKELSRAEGLRLGRAYARGLINVGYKPKWLDEEYPDPGAKVGEDVER